ncbi:hypothetical protein O4J56_10955 [Nocardiopsis sp. RSe5-2]|uniref:Uncharacterized protein n=2 Tax=Nocardiopsis endophytica TaxID=3018445 RepID=A0ABT4U2J0_9ACTN|nr:hypothetical protein [Nocardiopsis endophytica]
MECAERTGECLWVCGECGSIWRDGEDLAGPASAETNSYTSPPGGAVLSEFAPVPVSPRERSTYPKAVRAIEELVSTGFYDPFMLGMPVAEATALIGHVAPENGPVRLRTATGQLAEITIEPPGGPVPMPGDLPAGADLSLVNVSLAEEAINKAGGSSEKTGEFMGRGRLDFRAPETKGELHFVRYRLTQARVRLAD